MVKVKVGQTHSNMVKRCPAALTFAQLEGKVVAPVPAGVKLCAVQQRANIVHCKQTWQQQHQGSVHSAISRPHITQCQHMSSHVCCCRRCTLQRAYIVRCRPTRQQHQHQASVCGTTARPHIIQRQYMAGHVSVLHTAEGRAGKQSRAAQLLIIEIRLTQLQSNP